MHQDFDKFDFFITSSNKEISMKYSIYIYIHLYFEIMNFSFVWYSITKIERNGTYEYLFANNLNSQCQAFTFFIYQISDVLTTD